MFMCQVCKKEFKTLKEYAAHINAELDKSESEAKMCAEKEREAKLQDKEQQINELYEKLRTLIKEFNSTEGNPKTYVISMYNKQKKENDKDLVELLMEGLGW